MSTKIPHGYRLAEGTDVFAFADELRDLMVETRRRIELADVLRFAVFEIDQADMLGEARNPELLSIVRKKIRDLRADDEYACKVSFGRHDGRVLALLHVRRSEYETTWESLPEVSEFGYWDNTDRPDDVTEQEWDARRKAWNAVLGWSTPTNRMLVLTLDASAPVLVPGPNPGLVDVVKTAVWPTVDDRASKASSSLLNNAIKEHGDVPFDTMIELVSGVKTFDGIKELLDPNAVGDVIESITAGTPLPARQAEVDPEAMMRIRRDASDLVASAV